MGEAIGIVGLGYAVPRSVRTNDDPIFSALHSSDGGAELEFFGGSRERRVLGAGENIESLMAEAGRLALEDAGLSPEQIDRLYGSAFVSEYASPNGLFCIHRTLGLNRRVTVVPLNVEFSNFIAGLVLAWDAVAAGHCDYVMVNIGASMSRHMDYSNGHAAAIGDGAGCAIVGRSGRFTFLDHSTITISEYFDVMNMRCRFLGPDGAKTLPLDSSGNPNPTYEMGGAGLQTVMNQGAEIPPVMVVDLLKRHHIDPSRIALISHQPTPALMRRWADAIRPGQYPDTFAEFGNITSASVPITLAYHRSSLVTDYVVLLSPGTGTHFSTLLVKR